MLKYKPCKTQYNLFRLNKFNFAYIFVVTHLNQYIKWLGKIPLTTFIHPKCGLYTTNGLNANILPSIFSCHSISRSLEPKPSPKPPFSGFENLPSKTSLAC